MSTFLQETIKIFDDEFHFSDGDNPINIAGTKLSNDLKSFLISRHHKLIEHILGVIEEKKIGNKSNDWDYNKALSDLTTEINNLMGKE